LQYRILFVEHFADNDVFGLYGADLSNVIDGVLSMTMFFNIWTLPVKQAAPKPTRRGIAGCSDGVMHLFC
jgi:hypothetical protein